MVEDIATGRAEAAEESTRTSDTPTRLTLGAALAASAAVLAACGGGSSSGSVNASAGTNAGSLSALANTDTGKSYVYTQAKSDEEAARFLLQAQFSASETEIAEVRAKGYMPWLGEQFDRPPTQTGWDWIASKAYDTVNVDDMIWSQLMTAPDGVRKRMALAFTEIFVVSANEIGSSWPHHMMAGYWDMLVAGVGTNFRKLLEDVSLNPAMGYYLNTRGNQKENAQGRQPDENYGREVMQLMSLGLYLLNPDGTVKTAADGTPLDSYTQDDVTNIARVFTGYDLDIASNERGGFTPPGQTYTIETNDWTKRPMSLTENRHSTLEARFLGATVPAGTKGAPALQIALDTLYNHPNVGPFICKQLIQRMVTSNPSPAYVKRVADVFANNGAGVRGDMKSICAAVLLDNEARSPAGRAIPPSATCASRCCVASSGAAASASPRSRAPGRSALTSDTGRLGQSPLRSPSVFNFFRPGYVPPSTAIANAKMVAPEFQMVNETSVGAYLNFMHNTTLPNGFDSRDVIASYAAEKALVLDPNALVARLSLLLTGNQLSAATRSTIVGALAATNVTATSTDAAKLNRVLAAVLLVMGSPEYLIQK